MVFKRLIVLSDGTWQSETSAESTNILKLTKSIAPESEDGVQQVLYYDTGVGTGNAMDLMIGGAMGVGIDANIKEMYMWLAVNYQADDESAFFVFLPRTFPPSPIHRTCFKKSDQTLAFFCPP